MFLAATLASVDSMGNALGENLPSLAATSEKGHDEMKYITKRVAKDNGMLAKLLVRDNKEDERRLRVKGLAMQRCEMERKEQNAEVQRLRLELAKAKQQIEDGGLKYTHASPDLQRVLAPMGPAAHSLGKQLKAVLGQAEKVLGENGSDRRLGALPTLPGSSAAANKLAAMCHELHKMVGFNGTTGALNAVTKAGKRKRRTANSGRVPKACHGNQECAKMLRRKGKVTTESELQCIQQEGRWCPSVNLVGNAYPILYCKQFCQPGGQGCPATPVAQGAPGVAEIKIKGYHDPLGVCGGKGRGTKKNTGMISYDMAQGKSAGKCLLNVDLTQNSSANDKGPKAARWLPLYTRQAVAAISCTGSCLSKRRPDKGSCIPGCFDGITVSDLAVNARRHAIRRTLDMVMRFWSAIFTVPCSTVPPMACPWPNILWKSYSKSTKKMRLIKGYNTMQKSDYISSIQLGSFPVILLPAETELMNSTTIDLLTRRGIKKCPKPWTMQMACDPCNRKKSKICTKVGCSCDSKKMKRKALYDAAADITPPGGTRIRMIDPRFFDPKRSSTKRGGKAQGNAKGITKGKAKGKARGKARGTARGKGKGKQLRLGELWGAGIGTSMIVRKVAEVLKPLLQDSVNAFFTSQPWLKPFVPWIRCRVVDTLLSFKSFSVAELKRVVLKVGREAVQDFKSHNGFLRKALKEAVPSMMLLKFFPDASVKFFHAQGINTPQIFQSMCNMVNAVTPTSHHLHNKIETIRVIAPYKDLLGERDTGPYNMKGKAMPKTADWYMVRTQLAHFSVRGRKSHTLGNHRDWSKAVMWVTCIHEALKVYEGDSSLMQQYGSFTGFLTQTTGKRVLNNGEIKFDCKRYFKNQISSKINAMNTKKFNEYIKASGCTTRFRLTLGRCSTCCCRNGFFTNTIHHSLVHGSRLKCGTFFSISDALARTAVSMVRVYTMATVYAHTCFSAAPISKAIEDSIITTTRAQREAAKVRAGSGAQRRKAPSGGRRKRL